MRKIVSSLLLLFFIVIPALSVSANNMAETFKEVETIPLVKTDDESPNNNPRGILIVPIICHYSGGTFLFSFMELVENVTIRIINVKTGEQWEKSYDVVDSVLRISTSGTSGNYGISVYADEDCYTGVFNK